MTTVPKQGVAQWTDLGLHCATVPDVPIDDAGASSSAQWAVGFSSLCHCAHYVFGTLGTVDGEGGSYVRGSA